MPRRKRKTTIQRWLERWAYWYKSWSDPAFARRSEGGRKAAATRKANREDLRVAEDITRNEVARVFRGDPTP